MRTVVMRIRFTTPCLGNRRDNKQGGMLCHLRDGQNRIVFLQSWWDSAMTQAAQAFGRHQTDVRKIRWSPIIDGVPRVYRRYYKKDKARKHEAFRAGDEIAVKAMVPSEISLGDFRQLVDVLGEFFGISPFRSSGGVRNARNAGLDGGFGRFEVMEVREHGGHHQKESEHAGDKASDAPTARPDADADVRQEEAEVRATEGQARSDGPDGDVPVPVGGGEG